MRTVIVGLALGAFVGSATANESLGVVSPISSPNPAVVKANYCLQGARAAFEAYRLVTIDPAANIPMAFYREALEYRLKRQPFPASKEHAAKALVYIIVRLKNANAIPYEEWQVDMAVNEYVTKECSK
jgi:hypothetical protein